MKVREKLAAGMYENKLRYASRRDNAKVHLLYMEAERKLLNKFRLDLAQENGLLNHPKEKLLWDKAYESGHSSGLSEVEIHYTDLAELLK